MITFQRGADRTQRVRAVSDALFNVLTDVEVGVALDALARVLEEFQRAQRDPPDVLSADAILKEKP